MAAILKQEGGHARRETDRKRRLKETLALSYPARAVLLDELRWHVIGQQICDCYDSKARRSLFNSFARTIREQLPEYQIQKVAISGNTPVGLVAKVAVYRMQDNVALRRFLISKEPCILCRYTTNLDVDKPKYRPRTSYVVPKHHAATFRFFESLPNGITYDQLKKVPGTFIPATQDLTLIVPRGRTPDLAVIAEVPWSLFCYDDLSKWEAVKGDNPLKSVLRNRYC